MVTVLQLTGFVCYEKKYGHACIKAFIARQREKNFLLTFCAIAGNRGGFTGVSPFRPGGGVWGRNFFPRKCYILV